MKNVSTQPDHNEDANLGRATGPIRAPFADNRYCKYRFELESILLNAPECSGVYGLYGTFWIFIGAAENIRARLLEHLAGDNPCINRHHPSGFAFELVRPEERPGRLAQLIDELLPSVRSDLHNAAAGTVAPNERPKPLRKRPTKNCRRDSQP